VSVSDLYIPTLGLPILLQENMLTDPGNIKSWGRAIPFLGIHKWDLVAVISHDNQFDITILIAVITFLN
jgi:hypothetical protein